MIMIVVVGVVGCDFFIMKYRFRSEKGIQMSGNSSEPLFSDIGYNNEILMDVAPREVDVTRVKDGWRKVNVDGIVGWLPPQSIEYNNDEAVIIDLPVTSQFPEFHNGCEAVSVKMLLDKFGFNLTKEGVVNEFPLDDTEVQFDEYGKISVWGDPDKGFVGSMVGQEDIGFSINPGPVVNYLGKYFENPVDLTNVDSSVLERYIRAGIPVVVWITVGFNDVNSSVSWMTPDGKEINGTFDTHAMTLVGFDQNNYYLNDPFTGTQNTQVSKERFVDAWGQLGNKAVSVQ